MSLKKNLRTGQASLEYFILLAIMGALTFISATSFLANVQNSGSKLYEKAVATIIGPESIN